MEVQIESFIRPEISVISSGDSKIFTVSRRDGSIDHYGLMQGSLVGSSKVEDDLKSFLSSEEWKSTSLDLDLFLIRKFAEEEIVQVLDYSSEIRKRSEKMIEFNDGLTISSTSSLIDSVLTGDKFKCFKYDQTSWKWKIDNILETKMIAVMTCLRLRYNKIFFDQFIEIVMSPFSSMLRSLVETGH